MKHRPLVGVLLFIIYLAIICIAHCSCSPQNRIERRVSKAVAYLKAHHRLADSCAANYPLSERREVRSDTTISDSIRQYPTVDTILQFNLPLHLDTLKGWWDTYRDSTISWDPQTGLISIRYRQKCPPSLYRMVVVHDSVLTYQRDPAEITSLYQKLSEKEAAITALKKQTETLTISNHLIKRAKLGWMIAALLLGAGIVAYIAFKLR